MLVPSLASLVRQSEVDELLAQAQLASQNREKDIVDSKDSAYFILMGLQ